MESWNMVINTALLGTEKKTLRKEEVGDVLADAFEIVSHTTKDKEEAFLQTAALLYNVRQCGFVPLKKESVSLSVAEAEDKAYASPQAHAVLNEVVDSGSLSLLQFWLEGCAGAPRIVQPGYVPLLLSACVKTKALQPLVKTVCGKRGEWLMQFNDDWTWNEATTGDDLWQTGTLTQRKNILTEIRKADPAKARELLQQTWPQESAATKTDFLEVMLRSAGDEDVQWLETVLNEKSVKVKEAALAVLKTIPSSAVVQSYWSVLKESVKAVTTKGILGIGAKTVLEIKLVAVDKAVFKTGIQELPTNKKTPENVFVLQQLMAAVPPHLWESHLGLEKKRLIELFVKEAKGYVTALGNAAARFKDVDWFREIIATDEEVFYPEAFSLLPQKEAERYAVNHLANDETAFNVVQNTGSFSEEWSTEFSKAFLRFTAKNPYHYHKGFYNDMVHLLPVPVIAELEKCTPKEEHLRTMWSNLSEHLTKLLTLKLQTIKAFNE